MKTSQIITIPKVSELSELQCISHIAHQYASNYERESRSIFKKATKNLFAEPRRIFEELSEQISEMARFGLMDYVRQTPREEILQLANDLEAANEKLEIINRLSISDEKRKVLIKDYQPLLLQIEKITFNKNELMSSETQLSGINACILSEFAQMKNGIEELKSEIKTLHTKKKHHVIIDSIKHIAKTSDIFLDRNIVLRN